MNDQIFFFFYDLAHKYLFLDKLIVFFAHTFPHIVVLLAMIFLLFHHEVLPLQNPFKIFAKKWKEIVLVFFSGISAWCLSYVLKFLIQVPRPTAVFTQISSLLSANGYAFPSGHATFYMALAFALFFSHKKIGCIFIFFALLIGIARIVAGVHFPADILGGFILGTLTAYFVRYLYKKISR